MKTLPAMLANALAENQFAHVTLPMQQKLLRYLELMQTWNRAFNLTTITDPRDMVYLHLIDSLSVQPYLQGERLLDVGTGAGLPGIPLAIVNPDQHWVLLDKNSKKTHFLTQVIAELGLKNASAVHSRSEDFHPSQCFDSILSRALCTIRLFVETTEHLLCPQGLFIAMKGKYPKDEMDELPTSFQVQAVTRVDIKGLAVERHVVRLGIKR